MSSVPPSLTVRPRPSTCLLWWLFLLHLAVIAAVWLVDLGGWVKVLLAVGVAGSAVFGWRILYQGVARYLLVWHPTGDWSIARAGARAIHCDVWEVTWVDPKIVVLRFRLGRWRWLTLPLCQDSLPADTHRRLRARLLTSTSRL